MQARIETEQPKHQLAFDHDQINLLAATELAKYLTPDDVSSLTFERLEASNKNFRFKFITTMWNCYPLLAATFNISDSMMSQRAPETNNIDVFNHEGAKIAGLYNIFKERKIPVLTIIAALAGNDMHRVRIPQTAAHSTKTRQKSQEQSARTLVEILQNHHNFDDKLSVWQPTNEVSATFLKSLGNCWQQLAKQLGVADIIIKEISEAVAKKPLFSTGALCFEVIQEYTVSQIITAAMEVANPSTKTHNHKVPTMFNRKPIQPYSPQSHQTTVRSKAVKHSSKPSSQVNQEQYQHPISKILEPYQAKTMYDVTGMACVRLKRECVSIWRDLASMLEIKETDILYNAGQHQTDSGYASSIVKILGNKMMRVSDVITAAENIANLKTREQPSQQSWNAPRQDQLEAAKNMLARLNQYKQNNTMNELPLRENYFLSVPCRLIWKQLAYILGITENHVMFDAQARQNDQGYAQTLIKIIRNKDEGISKVIAALNTLVTSYHAEQSQEKGCSTDYGLAPRCINEQRLETKPEQKETIQAPVCLPEIIRQHWHEFSDSFRIYLKNTVAKHINDKYNGNYKAFEKDCEELDIGKEDPFTLCTPVIPVKLDNYEDPVDLFSLISTAGRYDDKNRFFIKERLFHDSMTFSPLQIRSDTRTFSKITNEIANKKPENSAMVSI